MNAKSIFGLLLLLLCASCQRDECIIRGVITEVADGDYMYLSDYLGKDIIRKSKFPQNPKRSVRFSGKRTKRSVQKRKARNTQKAETKVL